MDADEDSHARWLYRRCAAARAAMETPLSALQLSLVVLQFVQSIDEDAEDVGQMELFQALKGEGRAKKRDLSFVFDVIERAVDMRDDEELSEEGLRAIAAAVGDGAGASADGAASSVDGEKNKVQTSAAAAPSDAPPLAGDATTTASEPDVVDFDELHCFQLRTRVLGLNMPTFSELWRYLQMAGWTYTTTSGQYHIPKGRRGKVNYDTEGMTKRIYRHFNLDNESGQLDGDESEEEEEGPETFESPNDLVDYLDEYCMPDYRATSAEVHAQQAASAAKSKAYKRRSKRLRYELLEIAYRERLRKRQLAEEDDEEATEEKQPDQQQTVYGHNHRPCEACFKGPSPKYPRVACRGCGLVVHTNCYGLLDHGETEAKGKRRAAAVLKKEVDEKGLFTCDVCENKVTGGSTNKTTLWNAPQDALWRAHDLPNAICPLCCRQYIAGAMVHIEPGSGDGASGKRKKGRKRTSQRTGESSECWAHLFCINSLPSTSIAASSVRSSVSAVDRIHTALDNAKAMVRETESKLECVISCEVCGKRDGVLVECKGKCERFYHSICLQIDCADHVPWDDKKKEHICLRCRGIEKAEPVQTSKARTVGARKGKPPKPGTKPKSTDEIDQYFDRRARKRSKGAGAPSDDLLVPSQQECIEEVESLHRASDVDHAYDEFEAQYQKQFRELSFSMATGQSILLYGLGSKTSVLASFGQYLSAEGDVVSLNGYDPNIDLNQFLGAMNQLFCGGSGPTQPAHTAEQNNSSAKDLQRGLPKRAASIAKTFASLRSRPLFLLIHNVDGAGLRSSIAQQTIAALTDGSDKDGSPMIRIAASVDNVNAAMVLWPPQTECKFDWSWKKAHTYRPYLEEVRNLPQTEQSKKAKKSAGKQRSGAAPAVFKVLDYLAPRHTEALQALATLQLSNPSISYQAFRDECVRKMLAANDSALRSILKELIDHNIIASEKVRGVEFLQVPAGIRLHDIITYKAKQPN
ncbi:hypothetical protein ACHAXT_010442 [Thalassiosira profunda]